MVKLQPEYLKEMGREKFKMIVDEDIDMDLDKIRRRTAERNRETGDGAQGAEETRQTVQTPTDQEERGSITETQMIRDLLSPMVTGRTGWRRR